jgi:hypothetical protein
MNKTNGRFGILGPSKFGAKQNFWIQVHPAADANAQLLLGKAL